MDATLIQLLIPLGVLQLVLIIIALIDLRKIDETNGPKWMWVLIIIFFNFIGPVLYFIIGRRM
ncbi:PLD nuclease N-terminal domain-containing protein [Alkalibacillus haloalkaliphilus]|uniref:PLD nuclease N-terminal domain-containing protein n=1 Tax=Alkalibacillus haloalkaliphilus TaxID=94136 RepID=UPI0029357347|nr:PLD nuclease N-terminal domain-containing protein [Alkalibacillus haloalkaliphilus]MDV2581866.1 PLD nuclease N-terminal domain-containing protein [Alkalibacillus haloalkaliphilus]